MLQLKADVKQHTAGCDDVEVSPTQPVLSVSLLNCLSVLAARDDSLHVHVQQ